MEKSVKESMSQQPTSTASGEARAPGGAAAGWWIAAIVVLAVATWFAWRQPLPEDPFTLPPRLLTWAWWTAPIERNAFTRVAHSTVALGPIAALPGGRELWVATDNRLGASRDGGVTWDDAPVVAPGTVLTAVTFIDARQGWLASRTAASAEVWRTSDGRSWSQVAALPAYAGGDTIEALHFFGARAGWLRTLRGDVLSTSDGGATWARVDLPGKNTAETVALVSESSALALFSDGTLGRTDNGGRSWRMLGRPVFGRIPASAPKKSALRSVSGRAEFLPVVMQKPTDEAAVRGSVLAIESLSGGNEIVLWMVDGSLKRSRDGGATWQDEAPPTSAYHLSRAVPLSGGTALVSADAGAALLKLSPASGRAVPCLLAHNAWQQVRFAGGPRHGWLGGTAGFLFRTDDGGATWEPQLRPLNSALTAMTWISEQHGWAVDFMGWLARTADGGKTWERSLLSQQHGLLGLAFWDEREGIVTGEKYAAYTGDGGKTWVETALPDGATDGFATVTFTAPREAVAIGMSGQLWQTTDGGAHWSKGESPEGEPAKVFEGTRYYRMFDDQHGIALVFPGQLLVTDQGEKKFTLAASQRFAAVEFSSRARGVAVDSAGVVHSTDDGGKNWNAITAPRRVWPAPWYYLSWLVVGLMCWRGWHASIVTEPARSSVAQRAVSDQPVAQPEDDLFEHRHIARGLSRFIRNEATIGPFTVAVTGEWGTGKTSLMRLLKQDLGRYGVRPVWFNAWHHQHDEHYMPVLLENIVAQAVPPWCTPLGLMFRARLLWKRGWRAWLPLVFFALVACFTCGLLMRSDRAGVLEQVGSLIGATVSWFKQNAAAPSLLLTSKVVALVVSTFGFLRALWSGLSAFGVQPAKLLAQAAAGASTRELRAKMSLQRQFARDFRDVTWALGSTRPLVIFIDDLDRCQPAKTVQLLEAVDFLVSAGECFIVLGLAPKQVEACVGLGYEKLATEMAEQAKMELAAGAVAPEQKPEQQRARFARQYLKKLINLEVPVPPPGATQTRRLLTGIVSTENGAPPPPVAQPRRWTRMRRVVRQWAPLAVGVVAIAAASLMFNVGLHAPVRQWSQRLGFTDPATAKKITPPAVATTTGVDERTENSLKVRTPDPKPPAATTETARLVPSVGTWRWPQFAPALLVVIALGWVGVHLLTRRPDLVVHDSADFKDALGIWHPVIAMRYATPRDLKRFLNRVRYLAMKQSPDEDKPSAWERFLRQVGVSSPPEPLAANSTQIDEPVLVALAASDRLGVTNELPDGPLSAVLSQSEMRHQEKFADRARYSDFRTAYRELAEGVEVR